MEAGVEMTSKGRVKRLLTIDTGDTDFDVLLDDLIICFSDAAQTLMNRLTTTKARTRIYDVTPGSRTFILDAYGDPASTVTKVTHDLERTFGSSGTEILAADRAFNFRTGALYLDSLRSPGRQVLEVQYNAGMAVDVTAFVLNWSHLAHACEHQVAHIFNRRGEFGAERVSFRDNIITEVGDPSRWLTWVEQMFRLHRRKSLGK